ncbi:MAG: NADPH:quinone reductase [Vulcanimicrobiaceae bacterium]
MMRAAFYTKQGLAHDVLQLGEVPTPEPGAGEVRVKVTTSGVNPSDWKTRKGGLRGMFAPLIVPHSDGAGVVESVGPGTDRARIGQRVWLWNGQWKRAFGTAAEYVALPAAQAVPLPQCTDDAAGACLGIPAFTALQAVRLANAGPGTCLFVTGGAGSVANYAIQIAKLRGASVIATISSDEKAKRARAAGADATINSRTEDVGERVKAVTGGRGVDALIEMDLNANAKQYPSVLAPHATVVVYGMTGDATLPSMWMMQNSIDLRLFLIYEISEADRTAGIAEITKFLDEGKLVHNVALRLPLEKIADAHDIVERGEIMGNVVLDVVR